MVLSGKKHHQSPVLWHGRFLSPLEVFLFASGWLGECHWICHPSCAAGLVVLDHEKMDWWPARNRDFSIDLKLEFSGMIHWRTINNPSTQQPIQKPDVKRTSKFSSGNHFHGERSCWSFSRLATLEKCGNFWVDWPVRNGDWFKKKEETTKHADTPGGFVWKYGIFPIIAI